MFKPCCHVLPDEDGLFLCQMDTDHYAILEFVKGKWIPNDYNEFHGVAWESSFRGLNEENVMAWAELPLPLNFNPRVKKRSKGAKKEDIPLIHLVNPQF